MLTLNASASLMMYEMNGYIDMDLVQLGLKLGTCGLLLLTILIPTVALPVAFYFCAFVLQVCRWFYPPSQDGVNSQQYLNAVRTVFGRISYLVARIWHGYEIVGLENIPKDGPALLIGYHGEVVFDYTYFVPNSYLQSGRFCYTVLNKKFFNMPGLKGFIEACRITPRSYETCVQILQNKHLLVITPGGNAEQTFGGPYYDVVWGNRTGFARLALETKVPIIPVFTENIREVCRNIYPGRRILEFLKERRLRVLPFYGFFPVKLRTYVGKPIEYDPDNTTPQELAALTVKGMEYLIKQHQRLPGSLVLGLMDRFYDSRKAETPAEESED